MCERCAELERELQQVKADAENDRYNFATEITLKTRQVTRLKNEMAEKQATSKKAGEVRELLEHAKKTWGKRDNWAIDPGGDRWKVTLAQLNRPAYDFDTLKLCIDELAMAPWCGPRGYHGEEYPGSKKLLEIRYAYGTDDAIERWRKQRDLRENPQTTGTVKPFAEDLEAAREARFNRLKQQAARDIRREVVIPPINKVLSALNGLGIDYRPGQPDTWTSCCPAHDDRSPSLGIREAHDGKVLLLCRAGCETDEVVAALGLTFYDLFPNPLAA